MIINFRNNRGDVQLVAKYAQTVVAEGKRIAFALREFAAMQEPILKEALIKQAEILELALPELIKSAKAYLSGDQNALPIIISSITTIKEAASQIPVTLF